MLHPHCAFLSGAIPHQFPQAALLIYSEVVGVSIHWPVRLTL